VRLWWCVHGLIAKTKHLDTRAFIKSASRVMPHFLPTFLHDPNRLPCD